VAEDVLVASFGGQPQILTFTLDALLERHVRPRAVHVVFPGGQPRYQDAYRRLVAHIREYQPYQGLRVQAYGLRDQQGRPLPDVVEPRHLDAAWRQIRDLVRGFKQAGHRLHFSITGGRRALGLLLYAAAMTYGTPQDRVWHIYTAPEWLPRVRDGAHMHVPQGVVRLLEIPFVPWTAYIPGLRGLLETSPKSLRHLTGGGLDGETRRRCEQVWARLSPRQREALQALAATETRAEAAQKLGMHIDTLDSHRKAILKACREVWPSEQINLRFVRRVFRRWFASEFPTFWGDFSNQMGRD